MKVTKLGGVGYASSCYYVTDDAGENAVVIDPSVPPASLPPRADGRQARLTAILLTHAHYDHMLALDAWRTPEVPVCVPRGDAVGFSDPDYNVSGPVFGVPTTFSPPDRLLSEGDEIPLGDEILTVLLTPGHTAGGCMYRGEGVLFTGDTIFADGAIGRTDVSGGSFTALMQSIERVLSLPRDTVLYPGHGRPTTVGNECAMHGLI